MRLFLPSRAGLLLVCACFTMPAIAAPYTPASDDDVVETLRQRPLDAQERAARAQRLEARRQPTNLSLALQVARSAIERARRNGDPRELGQAQAALAPWWSQSEPPPAVRLMRAIVQQSRHEFAPALADLDRLISMDAPPALQAQAELTRASLLQVQGRYREAASACERLQGPRYQALGAGVQWPARVCLAELASLRGNARQAAATLDGLAAQAGAQQAHWLALVRAELAERLGNDSQAEALYRQALAPAGDRPEVYTLAAYADWLLNHQRAGDAAELLAGRDQADALLLRLARAWKQLGDGRTHEAKRELQQRFEATRLRGDPPHLREEAYTALHLQGDAPRALQLARDNWAQQKEPADALLLAEAAQAARQPQAAAPLRKFMHDSGYADVRLARWLP